MHALHPLSVVSGHYGVFPLHPYPAANLPHRYSGGDIPHEVFPAEVAAAQAYQVVLAEQSPQRRQGGEHLHVHQVLYVPSVLVHTVYVYVVGVDAFVEVAHGQSASCRHQRQAEVAAAQSHGACGSLVVVYLQHGHLWLPVRSYQPYLAALLHYPPCAVSQGVQHGRVRTLELQLDGIFLEHQVVFLYLDVGIGIVPRQVLLHVLYACVQRLGRVEVHYQLTVREGWQGYGPHQVVAPRRASHRSRHVAYVSPFHQILPYRLQVSPHPGAVGSLGQLVFYVALVVYHVGEEALPHVGESHYGCCH